MSSLDPLPPATPPSQKPTRIIKPRPPTRPRPYLPPRPDSTKLLRVPTPPLPLEKDERSQVTEVPGGPPQPLHKLQKSGAVRKIVVHFDRAGPPEKEEAEKMVRSPPSSCQQDKNQEEKAIKEKEVQDGLGKWASFDLGSESRLCHDPLDGSMQVSGQHFGN